jgi:outer membrane murein-binding lipoprotein Lpp
MKRFMILDWDSISRKYIELGTQIFDFRFINRKSSIMSIILCILSVAGCSNPKVKESPTIKIEQLTQENTKLTDQVEKLTSKTTT